MRSIATLFLILLVAGAALAAPAGQVSMDISAATVPPPTVATGLPVPRWVSVKAGRVNVRRGPSLDHDVLWTYVRPGTPIEIIAEYDSWRRIRDLDGSVGWVKSAMLDGRRNVVVKGNVNALIMSEPKPDSSIIAYAAPGVYAKLESCAGAWCEISARGYDGFVARDQLGGVYPRETIR